MIGAQRGTNVVTMATTRPAMVAPMIAVLREGPSVAAVTQTPTEAAAQITMSRPVLPIAPASVIGASP